MTDLIEPWLEEWQVRKVLVELMSDDPTVRSFALEIQGAPKLKPSRAEIEALRKDAIGTLAPPQLVQVNYSGGVASEALLWMILNGDLVPPSRFIVTCADPGMENPMTHVHTAAMERRCRDRGIPFLRAKVNLYEGILQAKRLGLTRFDFPAFFTKNRVTGKIGKMLQRCTIWCKSAPMDRLARHWMHSNMNIPITSTRIGSKILHKWIGFTADEWTRIKPLQVQKYVLLDYPFVNKGITKEHCLDYLASHGCAIPPRSVCNACFANDAAYFKMLYENHPEAWLQAVAIDEEIRDLSQFGMMDECYVYGACVPLLELARLGFPELRKQSEQCHSGHCFL